MSQETPNIVRSGRVIVGATAASVVLLLGVWLALGDRARAPGEAPQAVAEPFRGGVEAAAVDPVRRQDDDDGEQAAPDRRLAVAPVRPETATVEDRLRAQADRPPPAPPDPAILATQEARAAALPVAMAATQDAVDGRRSALRRACGSSTSTLYVVTSFTADGKLSEHSVADDGTAPDVAACVQQQLGSLTIAPPGVAVTTRAKLELR